MTDVTTTMADRILLVGMMGVGKTTVGRALAGRLGWTYLDSDEQVLAATGRTVKQISLEEGLETLHRFEDDALVAAIQSRSSVVVGVAGGALLVDANRALLEVEPHVVWLRASLETLAVRIGIKGDRPFFDGDPAGTLRELYEVRRPLYAEVATVTIDVDECTTEEIVGRILTALDR
jgi:shikimate kinase